MQSACATQERGWLLEVLVLLGGHDEQSVGLCSVVRNSGYEKGAPSLKTKCANKNTYVQNITFE